MLRARGIAKTFTLPSRAGARIAALDGVSLDVEARRMRRYPFRRIGRGQEHVPALHLRQLSATGGTIAIRDDSRESRILFPAHACLAARRDPSAPDHDGLREPVHPRDPARQRIAPDLVSEPLVPRGVGEDNARARASERLERLHRAAPPVDARARDLLGRRAAARVNIARGLIAGQPLLLLDEPTASLDAENRDVVAEPDRRGAQSGRGDRRHLSRRGHARARGDARRRPRRTNEALSIEHGNLADLLIKNARS